MIIMILKIICVKQCKLFKRIISSLFYLQYLLFIEGILFYKKNVTLIDFQFISYF